jgi:two-component system, sensor histidine kinase YesM
MRQKNNMSEPRPRRSLKWSLISLIVTCWILPLALVGGLIGYYITNNLNSQIDNTVKDSVNNSVKMCLDKIDASIYSSRAATYDATIANAYEQYKNDGNDYQAYQQVSKFLNKQYPYDDKFDMTLLYFCDMPDNVFYVLNNNDDKSYSNVTDYKTSVQPKVVEFAKTLGTQIGFMCVDGKVYMVRNLVDSTEFRPYAVIVMQLNTAAVFENLTDVVWATKSTVWLNGTPVSLKGPEIDVKQQEIKFPYDGDAFVRYKNNQSLIYGARTMSSYTMSYAIDIDSTSLTKQFDGLRVFILFLGLLIIPLLAVVIFYFYKNVTRPISNMLKAYLKIENGSLGYKITENFSNLEFNYFKDAFNNMSGKLKEQFECIYREEVALRDARIIALQSQINPHFLNNTLEIINWQARMTNDMKVSNMIEALSTMLDAAMDRSRNSIVSLKEEMRYVDAYLYIVNVRMGRRLSISKEIDDGLMECTLPRLVMQPIIENEVEHGDSGRRKRLIVIRVYQDGENLVLEVESDGLMADEDAQKIKLLLSGEADLKNESYNHLGIRNVQQRLQMIYGDQGKISITTNEKGHTLSQIILPSSLSSQ